MSYIVGARSSYTDAMKRPSALLALSLLAACSGGGDEEVVPECRGDSECEAGQFCQDNACVLPSRLDCPEEGASVAGLLASPDPLDFGVVATEQVERSLTLGNEGTCNLQIVSAEIEGGANSRFVCASCISQSFPLRILPGRGLRFEMTVNPGAPGTITDRLVLRTNDPNNRERYVQLTAESTGQPALRVDPLALDFGFVPAGGIAERVVQAINATDGSAVLEVQSARIEPEDSPAFSVAPMTLLPVSLAPATVDPSARAAFTVRYEPPEQMSYAAELVITGRDSAPIRIPLSSDGEPPAISVNPVSIDLGSIRLGESAARSITIQNTGRSDLVGGASLQVGSGNDLSLVTTDLRIAPGGLAEIGVIYEPTRGGAIGDTVIIQTNDPTNPRVLVSVSGTAVPAAEQVVSVEMTYENGSSSALDKDLRDVDLYLESPVGLVVGKASPMGAWGAYGAARWSAPPPGQLERVVLGRAMQDGEYVVNLSYIEDCSTLPTALTAALLGIGTDELVRALSEDEVVIDPTALANAVQQACAQRSSTNATVVTTVDGAVVDTRQVRLSQKGDLVLGLKLRVTNGRFSVIDP